jgi:hypothetical protein
MKDSGLKGQGAATNCENTKWQHSLEDEHPFYLLTTTKFDYTIISSIIGF